MAKQINCVMSADGETIGVLNALPKGFATGSRGYYDNGKMVIDGKRYQVSVMFVEIGSKPDSKSAK